MGQVKLSKFEKPLGDVPPAVVAACTVYTVAVEEITGSSQHWPMFTEEPQYKLKTTSHKTRITNDQGHE